MIHARFFKGRANAWRLTLESNGVAVDPASIDRIELKWAAKGALPAGSVDSVTHPAAFTREANGWIITLGALDLSVGSYIMTILAYGPAFPQGMNFTPKDLASIEILPG